MASQRLPCYPRRLWLTSYHHHQHHHDRHHCCHLGADGASELNELLSDISQALDGGSVGVHQLQQDLKTLTFNSDSDFNYDFFLDNFCQSIVIIFQPPWRPSGSLTASPPAWRCGQSRWAPKECESRIRKKSELKKDFKEKKAKGEPTSPFRKSLILFRIVSLTSITWCRLASQTHLFLSS